MSYRTLYYRGTARTRAKVVISCSTFSNADHCYVGSLETVMKLLRICTNIFCCIFFVQLDIRISANICFGCNWRLIYMLKVQKSIVENIPSVPTFNQLIICPCRCVFNIEETVRQLMTSSLIFIYAVSAFPMILLGSTSPMSLLVSTSPMSLSVVTGALYILNVLSRNTDLQLCGVNITFSKPTRSPCRTSCRTRSVSVDNAVCRSSSSNPIQRHSSISMAHGCRSNVNGVM